MNHILSFDNAALTLLKDTLFPSIASGNSILFLGAGASVTERHQFLGRHIIDYYRAHKSFDLDTENLTEFVDILSDNPTFDREDFDEYVASLLSSLTIIDLHKIIAAIRWKEIITTNSDLLIEKAYDVQHIEGHNDISLIPIRTYADANYNGAIDEIRYVKLNGCISDKKQYPLVFSSQDFKNAHPFYKVILRNLENMSPKICFLSVGYSYTDPLSVHLLKHFDKYGYRNKRWLVSIDPFVKDAQLPFFSSNRIQIVRVTAEAFFGEYKKWIDSHHAYLASSKRPYFTDPYAKRISVSNRSLSRLADSLHQLSDISAAPSLSATSFYRGEAPTFEVVRQNFDVIKHPLVAKLKDKINELLSQRNNVVPILLLTGSYGTGKTTLTYRTILEILHVSDSETLSFEVVDPKRLNMADLHELCSQSQAHKIILLFNGIEVDSAFKALIECRSRINTEQIPDVAFLLLGSIRDNILQMYKVTKNAMLILMK